MVMEVKSRALYECLAVLNMLQQCCEYILCILIKVACSNLSLSDSSRKTIFLSLLVISILGTLSFLVLRKSHHDEELLSEEEGQSLLSTRMM